MSNYNSLRASVERAVSAKDCFAPVDILLLAELLAEFDALRSAAPAKKGGYTAEFESAWADYPKRPGDSKAAAFKAWTARIKAGATAEAMINGVVAYAAHCKRNRTEPQFIKQAATFFGPGEHFAADWAPAAGAPAPRNMSVADQQAANNAEARRIMGLAPRRSDDDGMTFDMVPA